MASNPIQKKVRNAGLLGATITLLIMGVVVVFLLLQLSDIKNKQKEIEASYVNVYSINQDVESGQVITQDMIQMSRTQKQYVPTNAQGLGIEEFGYYSLSDSEGNPIYTDEIGPFILKDCKYTEIFEDENKGIYYTYSSEGEKVEVKGIDKDDILEDNYDDKNNKYIIKEATQKTRVYKETYTDEYYILTLRYDTNERNKPERVKESIKIVGMPLIAKVNMGQNTVLTLDLVSRGTPVTDDVRKQEYNIVVLPTDLITGDYIDIRLQLPNGLDFIVVSKKQVELPVIEGMESTNTIWLNLSEDEILTMSCAIVEAYRINGAKLYATKYSDPGIQDAATPTYPISSETLNLIQKDPNVVPNAMQELLKRYNSDFVTIRIENIYPELQKEENSASNVPGKINESIQKTQEERKKYLQSISGQ